MAIKKAYFDLQVDGEISGKKIMVEGEYSLPLTDGVAGQLMSTDGAGNVSFINISTLGLLNPSSIVNGTGISWTQISPGILQGDVNLTPFSTTDLIEGTRLYFTNERVDDRVNSLLLAGTGITKAYNDGANSLTLGVTLAPFSTTDLVEGTRLYFTNERVDDRVAALVQNSASVTWTYDDSLNTLTANAVTSPLQIEKDGVLVAARGKIDFITGSNTTLTVLDDVINSKVTVQIDSAVGAIDDLSDVAVSSPNAGEILAYVGPNWQNVPDTAVIQLGAGTGSSVRVNNSNTASGDCSTVSGGYLNIASNCDSTIAGGLGNTSSGYQSTIAGGNSNSASGNESFIGGGLCNTASSGCSTVGGGERNTASGSTSTVSGGYCNIASCVGSTVSGGSFNTVSEIASTVSGGNNNSITQRYSTISGGWNNSVCASCSTIGGGLDNTVSSQITIIAGGRCNIASGTGSSISGGVCNTSSGCYSIVGGGLCNTSSGLASVVSGGQGNVSSCNHSVIGGGCNNASSYYGTAVGGGYCNTASGFYSTVSGGYGNVSNWNYSTVSGGYANTASSQFTTVGGGINNIANGATSTIGGGYCNTASCGYTTVSGGKCNVSSNIYSTVSGGYCNVSTCNFSVVSGGAYNTASGIYSTVGGGCRNTASGCWSAVLGGYCNTLTHTVAGAFGCNIASVCNNTFHTNYLNLYNTPESDTSNTASLVRDTATGQVKVRYQGGLFAQNTSSTPITGTVTETSVISTGVGTLTVPANGFTVGDSFGVSVGGVISSANGETVQIRIKSGAVLLADTGVVSLPALSGRFWSLQVQFTVRAIGGAGVASIAANGMFSFSSSGFDILGSDLGGVESTNFNTTASNTLSVTAQWGSTNATNTIYSNIFVVNKNY
jgi:hypothetical protein